MWDTNNWLKEEDEVDAVLLQSWTELLNQIQLHQFAKDLCYWAADEDEGFSVKACVTEIRKRGNEIVLQGAVLRKPGFMWELKVPSKIRIFAWRFILGRLSTRDQLKKRGILVEDRDFCMCVLF